MAKTIKDLGKKIKATNPGVYDDMSDEEVGRKTKAKFPQYADYEDVSIALPEMKSLTSWRDKLPSLAAVPSHVPKTQELTTQVIDFYNPKKGRFTSWWQRGKAESRNKLLTVLNEEQLLVIRQGAMLEEAVRNGKKSEAEFYTFLTQQAATIHSLRANEALINQALAKGRTVQTDQHIKVAEAESEIRQREAERLSKIKVQEHEYLQAVDLKVRWEEIEQDLRMADMADTAEQTIIQNLRSELTTAKRERYNLKHSDEPEDLKLELLKDYNKYIKNLEAHISERETRRLQNTAGSKSQRRSKKSPTARSHYPPPSDED